MPDYRDVYIVCEVSFFQSGNPACRLIDVYDARDEMTLISELATGGELLDTVTQEKYITEIEVARIVIQGRSSALS